MTDEPQRENGQSHEKYKNITKKKRENRLLDRNTIRVLPAPIHDKKRKKGDVYTPVHVKLVSRSMVTYL